jgi:4,5-dihydroxyphthalate decarboxylase
MMPWISAHYDPNRSLFGYDWAERPGWRRPSVEAFLRWDYEQGLSRRRLTCEDIFVPELVNT